MTGYTIPFGLARQRRSPLVRNRRDLVVTAGDEFALALTIYDNESASAPANITGTAARLSIVEDDTNTVVFAADAVIVSASTGRMNITFPASATRDLAGRYRVIIQLDFDAGVSAVVHGVLNVERGAPVIDALSGVYVPPDLVTISISDAVLTEGFGGVVPTISISIGVLTEGGPGDGPIVFLAIPTVTFGSTSPDTFSPVQTIPIANIGNEPLIITAITVSGDFEITARSPD